ncbi:hypothetical protein ABQX22_14155 [Xanthomonas sp. WHRI 1810A]|uniref:hypothetical protein n=1 Tax=Xanthomonas sp. WHRI 1810A TaxID=3161565 RepID=UPI0032E90F5F
MSLGHVVAVSNAASTLRIVAVAVVVGIVMSLLIAIQQTHVVSLEGKLNVERDAKQVAVNANEESQATVTTLKAEATRNVAYTADLNKRIEASKDKAKKARTDFDDLKRNSKTCS